MKAFTKAESGLSGPQARLRRRGGLHCQHATNCRVTFIVCDCVRVCVSPLWLSTIHKTLTLTHTLNRHEWLKEFKIVARCCLLQLNLDTWRGRGFKLCWPDKWHAMPGQGRACQVRQVLPSYTPLVALSARLKTCASTHTDTQTTVAIIQRCSRSWSVGRLRISNLVTTLGQTSCQCCRVAN